MNRESAAELIRAGEKLMYIRYWSGSYYLCNFRFDEAMNNECKIITSWVWDRSESAYRVHYLDLPTLEGICASNSYTIKYEDESLLIKNKVEFEDRMRWKDKVVIAPEVKLEFRPYQNIGSQYMYRLRRCLNADAMGCLDGDTEIIINRGGKGFRIKMKDLYESFNGRRAMTGVDRSGGVSRRGGKIWDGDIPTMTRSLNGDHFSLNKIIGVVKKGVRKTLRITTDSGKKIIATPDHVFFTPNGEVEIGTLTIGDELYVNGKPVCKRCGKDRKLTKKKFSGNCLDCIYKYLRRNTIKTGETLDKNGYLYVSAGMFHHPRVTSSGVFKHRIVYEADMNGIPYNEYLLKLKMGDTGGIKFLSSKDVIHHKDGDRNNNSTGNLLITNASNHGREHGDDSKRRLWNVEGPKVERIVSIEIIGDRVVYDIMMADPLNSFIANGFVVHNSGKTAQTLGAIILNKMDGKPYRTVVLCPSSVKGNWAREVRKFTNLRPMVIASEPIAKRKKAYEIAADEADILMINYELFLRDHELIAKHFSPDILVLDECHRIVNRKNKITRMLIGRDNFVIRTKPHSIYLLTGTPIVNRIEDLYSIFKLIDPGLFSGWFPFVDRYCVQEEVQLYGRKSFMKTIGYKNQRELKAKIQHFIIRRTKDEILPELPPKILHIIEIELSAEEKKVYAEYRKEIQTKFAAGYVSDGDKLRQLTRSIQICDSLALLPDATSTKSSKMEELIKIVADLSEEHKIVIFSKFKKMTDIMVAQFKHLNPAYLHGTVKGDRQDIIDKFVEDKTCRLFIATTGAGGTGINRLQEVSDVVVMYDRMWSPAMNNQAIDRLHRIGQEHKGVNIIFLRCKDTIEERVEKIWLGKQELINEMINDEDFLKKVTNDELANLI